MTSITTTDKSNARNTDVQGVICLKNLEIYTERGRERYRATREIVILFHKYYELYVHMMDFKTIGVVNIHFPMNNKEICR